MDILFITPNVDGRYASESTGTLLLNTIVHNAGLDSELLPFFQFGDIHNFPAFLDNAVTMIVQRQPKIVSFYTRCDNYHIVLKIAQQVKAATNAYIVLGGPQSDIVARPTLEQLEYVDFICRGEGEATVVPFFSSLLQGTPDLTVPGLVYRSEGRVQENPRPAMIQNLDDLPKINYSLTALPLPDSVTFFSMEVGRGCPFGCTYCSTNRFWGRSFRLKSPQRIVEEIVDLNRQFGITSFVFDHDMFTMRRQPILTLCQLLKQLPFSVSWSCSARIDCIDEELIDVMADAGLNSIYVGIETGSPRMQKVVNKNLKLDRAMELLHYLHSKHLRITTSFIYGIPEETEEDLSQTLAMIRDIAAIGDTTIQTHLCTFLAGTELSEKYAADLTPTKHYSDITGMAGVADCADLIESHPMLFQHFWEYRTELRSELVHFPLFCSLWTRYLLPVYAHISKQYDRNSLIQMYFDFAQANGELLDRIQMLPSVKQFEAVLEQDRFLETFRKDPLYDVMADYQKLTYLKFFGNMQEGKPVNGVFCFSPAQLDLHRPLEDYSRGIYMARFARNAEGKLDITIRSRSL